MKAPLLLLTAALLTGCHAQPTALQASPPDQVSEAAETRQTAIAAKAPESMAMAATVQAAMADCAEPLGVVYGQLYDHRDQPIKSGATVRVVSLDPGAPFEASVEAIHGAYMLSQAPVGVPLEVRAQVGAVTRARRLTLAAAPCAEAAQATRNFGGPATQEDPAGTQYFLPVL